MVRYNADEETIKNGLDTVIAGKESAGTGTITFDQWGFMVC